MTTVTAQVQINASQDIVWNMLKTLHALHEQTEVYQAEHAHGRHRRHRHRGERMRSQVQNIIWEQGKGLELKFSGGGHLESGTLQLTLASEQSQTLVTQRLDYESKRHSLTHWQAGAGHQRIQQHLEHHLHQLKTAAETFTREAS